MRKLEPPSRGECRRDEGPVQGMGKRFRSTETDANSCQAELVATLDQEAMRVTLLGPSVLNPTLSTEAMMGTESGSF